MSQRFAALSFTSQRISVARSTLVFTAMWSRLRTFSQPSRFCAGTVPVYGVVPRRTPSRTTVAPGGSVTTLIVTSFALAAADGDGLAAVTSGTAIGVVAIADFAGAGVVGCAAALGTDAVGADVVDVIGADVVDVIGAGEADVVGDAVGVVEADAAVVGDAVGVDAVDAVGATIVDAVGAVRADAAPVDAVVAVDAGVDAGASLPSTVIVTPIARPRTAPHAITASTWRRRLDFGGVDGLALRLRGWIVTDGITIGGAAA